MEHKNEDKTQFTYRSTCKEKRIPAFSINDSLKATVWDETCQVETSYTVGELRTMSDEEFYKTKDLAFGEKILDCGRSNPVEHTAVLCLWWEFLELERKIKKDKTRF